MLHPKDCNIISEGENTGSGENGKKKLRLLL
jgi:hypothetical protein